MEEVDNSNEGFIAGRNRLGFGEHGEEQIHDEGTRGKYVIDEMWVLPTNATDQLDSLHQHWQGCLSLYHLFSLQQFLKTAENVGVGHQTSNACHISALTGGEGFAVEEDIEGGQEIEGFVGGGLYLLKDVAGGFYFVFLELVEEGPDKLIFLSLHTYYNSQEAQILI